MITLISDRTAAAISPEVQLVDVNASAMVVIKGGSTGEEFPVEVEVAPGVYVPLTVDNKNILHKDTNFVTINGRVAFRVVKPVTATAVGVYLVCATHEVSVGT